MTWASCQIRKIAGAHVPGMPGTFSPPRQVSDPDMHHGTCVTHVPWCMSGSLTSGFLRNRRWGKTFPAFPAHAQTTILRIWFLLMLAWTSRWLNNWVDIDLKRQCALLTSLWLVVSNYLSVTEMCFCFWYQCLVTNSARSGYSNARQGQTWLLLLHK